MKKLTFLIWLFTSSFPMFSQAPGYDLHILVPTRSSVEMQITSKDTITTEWYRMTWSEKDKILPIRLSVDSTGKLFTHRSLPTRSHQTLVLRYENVRGENPPKLIFDPRLHLRERDVNSITRYEIQELNLLWLAEFPAANQAQLFTIIKEARNLYIIVEEEKAGNYYLAKKVKVVYP